MEVDVGRLMATKLLCYFNSNDRELINKVINQYKVDIPGCIDHPIWMTDKQIEYLYLSRLESQNMSSVHQEFLRNFIFDGELSLFGSVK